MVSPEIVTVFAVPTVLVANSAVAPLRSSPGVSPKTIPESAAEVVTSCEVASTVRSYTRLLAVMPVTVSVFAIIVAVVVG